MAVNSFKVKRSLNIEPQSSPSLTENGDIAVSSSDNKLKLYAGGTTDSVVTEVGTATLENKTISADDNTISDIPASNIVFTPAGDTAATDVQAAIEEVQTDASQALSDSTGAQTDIDNHIADATAAHSASAIAVTPVGAMTSTDVQAGLQEIQTDASQGIADSAAAQADATQALSDAAAAQADATQALADAATAQSTADSKLDAAEKGAANGVAELDSNSKVPAAQLPAIAIVDVYVVADITARDALTVQEGDVAQVADSGDGFAKAYIYDGAVWVELQSDAELTAHAAAETGIHGVSGDIVGTSDAQTLTNKTLTTPIISTISNTGTITLPSSTDTLVGRDTTDTFTNKTIAAGSNTITGLANANIDAAAAIARSKLAAGTAHGAVVNDASGVLTSVAPGTSGNVLRSDGTQWTSAINTVAAAPDIELYLDTGNGLGAVNTAIRRFTNSRRDTLGAYATYADSANDAASVTITSTGAGVWAVQYTDQSSAAQTHGVSLNSAVLTTSIVSVTYAQGKRAEASCNAGGSALAAWTGRLVNGDVIRPHGNGSNDGTGNRVIFHMIRLSD